MSIYHNLRTETQYKAATGISNKEFELLFVTFEKLYTPKVANPYYSENQPVLTNKREALFFILHYLKSYPTLQNMGLYFGFSNFTASQYIDLLKPILRDSLQQIGLQTVRLFKDQSSFEETFKDVKEIVIDVTEIPVERPVNQIVQELKYSGKKKFHTLKWLIICDLLKRIYFISPAFPGSVHDFTIYKIVLGHIDFSQVHVLVDLGFLGIKKQVIHQAISIPHKSSKNNPLTAEKKDQNKVMSSQRVCVENSISGLKRNFLLRTENRMRKPDKLDDFVEISSYLWNYLIKYRSGEVNLKI